MEIKRLFDILYNQQEKQTLEVCLAKKTGETWKTYSTQEYIDIANSVSRGLLKIGIKKGDKIAIVVDNNCPEWNFLDIGIQQVGAVSVPVYSTISAEEYEYIFNDAEVKVCFASNLELISKVSETQKKTPSLEYIYSIEKLQDFSHWEEILDSGKKNENQNEVEQIKNSVKEDDLATLIYTSGTTGKPKGVMLSHKNLVSNVIASRERIPPLGEKPKALSFLPICHVFERMIIYLYQYSGISIYYAENMDKISDNLKEISPQVMTVVPRVIEKVYGKIYETGMNSGAVKSKIFAWALNLIEDYDPLKKNKPLSWYLKYKVANKLVFSKWREGLGGEIVTLVSGSAKLSEQLNRMFWAAGIPILEGYGLTETSPVISVNSFNKNGFEVGSVGKPLKNVDVKIAEDGEILVKAPSVFKGYYKNPAKTKEAFTPEGYFKTGDIGVINSKGILKITDRKKQIFKTSGGKYIAPEPIQNKMLEIPFIAQIMVVGEGQKMPCAIIQPNFDYIRNWAEKNNLNIDLDPKKITENKQVIDEIQKGIDDKNKHFGHWEQVKRFVLTPEEWTIDNDLLTPTLKMKRKNIKERYIDLYNELYEN